MIEKDRAHDCFRRFTFVVPVYLFYKPRLCDDTDIDNPTN